MVEVCTINEFMVYKADDGRYAAVHGHIYGSCFCLSKSDYADRYGECSLRYCQSTLAYEDIWFDSVEQIETLVAKHALLAAARC